MVDEKVIVIGAGIAGLSAARVLKEQNSLLLEREGFIGGPLGRVYFAGDYLKGVGTHNAIEAGRIVATRVKEAFASALEEGA